MRSLAAALAIAGSILLLAGAASAPAKPRDCGAVRFGETTTHVVVLRGTSCATARRVARRYAKGRPSGRWACALAHAPFRKVLGREVGFSCGSGGRSGDITKWPRAFVGTM